MRLLTFNLGGLDPRHGPWAERRGPAVAAIAAASPDVVALQAVARPPGGPDQAAELASCLPEVVDARYIPAASSADETTGGVALLARAPLGEVRAHRLSRRPDAGDPTARVLLHARPAATRPFDLLAAHLSWVAEQAEDNLREVLAVACAVSGPRLLLGDLNQAPDAPVLEPLRRLGWVDAWGLLRPGEDGFTFETGRPFARIDQAWASPELAGRLRAVELVAGDAGPGGVHASDHLGLLVTLEDY